MAEKKVALITGASSGIGEAVYKMMIAKGWIVYGTSRKAEKGATAEKDSGYMINMEVTDEKSVTDAISLIINRQGRLDAVVNNAGYGIAGSVEDATYKETLDLFDANFFGALRVIKEGLKHLKKTRGTIVNISSVAGVLSIPFQSQYSASKAAMESMSESLRMETKPFGVRVCLVLPGDTKTGFTGSRIWAKAAHGSDYQERMKASIAKMEHDEQNGVPPEKVANVVLKMIEKKNPPVRRAVGFSYQILLFLKRLLPDRVVIWILSKMYA